MLIKQFIEARFYGPDSIDFIFNFYSPYYEEDSENSKRSLTINLSKHDNLCQNFLNKKYNEVVDEIITHLNRHDWLGGVKKTIFNVDNDNKVITIRDGYVMGGLDQVEWHICNVAAISYMLWVHLKEDEKYTKAVKSGVAVDDMTEKFFGIINNSLIFKNKVTGKEYKKTDIIIPDYNVYPSGTYRFIKPEPVV